MFHNEQGKNSLGQTQNAFKNKIFEVDLMANLFRVMLYRFFDFPFLDCLIEAL